MGTRYASTTDVSPERSRQDIERVVAKYGGDDVVIGTSRAQQRALVECLLQGRRLRFTLPLPAEDEGRFRRTPTGRVATQAAAEKAYEQEVKSRWRALLLIIKATLEAVESGIVTAEVGFMPYLVLPNGSTVAEHLLPRVTAAIDAGSIPSSFLAIEGSKD